MPLISEVTAQGFARAHNSSADAALGLERSALMEKKPVSDPSLLMETQSCWDSADVLKDNTSDLLIQDGCLGSSGFGECRGFLDGSENSSNWNVIGDEALTWAIDSECAGAWHQNQKKNFEQYCNSRPTLIASLSYDLAEACFSASQGDWESEFDVGFF